MSSASEYDYYYDQVYPYVKILQEVKDLMLPTIENMVNPEDLQITGLSKQAFADFVYTQIMSLGYNDGDINATINDLMPTRSHIIYHGPAEVDAVNMAMHLSIISEDYQHQVRTFKDFHQMTQQLQPHADVIRKVKLNLLPLSL